jgi:hypothetical protein
VPPESLARLQRRFWRLITAPEGVAEGLAELAGDDPGASPLAGWIAAPDEDAARQRLDLYAGMYFFRLLDALAGDLPSVAGLLGDGAFHDLVVDYLVVHPPTEPSLRHAGKHMPAFLAGHEASGERPDLADLARLDLARNDVFDAARSPRLDRPALAALPPEAWPRLRLRVAPAVRWLRLRGSVLPTWQALSDGVTPPPPSGEPTGCVIWRSRAPGHEDQVWHREASLTEVAALDAVAANAPFERVCEVFAAAEPALAALVNWVADGLLSELEP